MRGSIPDLYLKGQGEYFDVLRVNVQAADIGQKTAKQALDDTARDWDRIARAWAQGPDCAVAPCLLFELEAQPESVEPRGKEKVMWIGLDDVKSGADDF